MKLLLTGDYCPCHAKQAPGALSAEERFGRKLLDRVAQADLAIVNLETPLTRTPVAVVKTGPVLRTDPEWISPLREAGFHMAVMANNHILDCGPDALLQTQQLCRDHEITSIGVGKNLAEAATIHYQTIGENTLAVINACEREWCIAKADSPGANPLDAIGTSRAIAEAKQHADQVLVVAHAGNEITSYPPPSIVELYRFFVEQGADAVIGHHSHSVQGYEIYRGAPIVYSLGNFYFPHSASRPAVWHEGMVAELTLPYGQPDDLQLHPFALGKEDDRITWYEGEQKVEFESRLAEFSHVLDDLEEVKTRWLEALDSQSQSLRWYLISGSKPAQLIREGLRKLGLLKWVVSRNTRSNLLRLHLMRAESLRSLLIASYEKMISTTKRMEK